MLSPFTFSTTVNTSSERSTRYTLAVSDEAGYYKHQNPKHGVSLLIRSPLIPPSIPSTLHLIRIPVSCCVVAVVFWLVLLLLDSLLEPQPGLGNIHQAADEQSPKTFHGVPEGRQEKARAAVYLRCSLCVSVWGWGLRRRGVTGVGGWPGYMGGEGRFRGWCVASMPGLFPLVKCVMEIADEETAWICGRRLVYVWSVGLTPGALRRRG